MRAFKITTAACALAALAASTAFAQEIDWKKVDEAFGRSAAAVGGDVHRYGFPRTDLHVTLDGVTIKPAFALGGWIALKPAHGGAMAMGDLVLLESEVNPVMAKLIEGSATMRTNDALEDDEIADGYILTCQAVPDTPSVTVQYE